MSTALRTTWASAPATRKCSTSSPVTLLRTRRRVPLQRWPGSARGGGGRNRQNEPRTSNRKKVHGAADKRKDEAAGTRTRPTRMTGMRLAIAQVAPPPAAPPPRPRTSTPRAISRSSASRSAAALPRPSSSPAAARRPAAASSRAARQLAGGDREPEPEPELDPDPDPAVVVAVLSNPAPWRCWLLAAPNQAAGRLPTRLCPTSA